MDVGHSFSRTIVALIALTCAMGCAPQQKDVESVCPSCEETLNPKPDCNANAVEGHYIARWEDGRVTRVRGLSKKELRTQFVEPNLANLKFVEPDFEIRISPSTTMRARSPHDPNIVNWGTRAIKAPEAWAKGAVAAGVIVAVIDSGVDVTHPQLVNQVYVNQAEKDGQPGVDDDGNGYIDDVGGWNFVNDTPVQSDEIGHGTHVAGIIAADKTAGEVQGVAPKAKILPLDFITSGGGGLTSDAILAIQYAEKMGAKVINASWGSSQCSKTLQTMVNELADRNILFAAAAGNSGQDISLYPEFPAAFQNKAQVTVAASAPEFLRAGFSNYGDLVQVIAPGKDIYSTVPGGKLAFMDGTSMATPFVAGEAAILFGVRPQATVAQIREAILNSVKKGPFLVSTQGQIDVDQAVDFLKNLIP